MAKKREKLNQKIKNVKIGEFFFKNKEKNTIDDLKNNIKINKDSTSVDKFSDLKKSINEIKDKNDLSTLKNNILLNNNIDDSTIIEDNVSDINNDIDLKQNNKNIELLDESLNKIEVFFTEDVKNKEILEDIVTNNSILKEKTKKRRNKKKTKTVDKSLDKIEETHIQDIKDEVVKKDETNFIKDDLILSELKDNKPDQNKNEKSWEQKLTNPVEFTQNEIKMSKNINQIKPNKCKIIIDKNLTNYNKWVEITNKPFEIIIKGVKMFDSTLNVNDTIFFYLNFIIIKGVKYNYKDFIIKNKE